MRRGERILLILWEATGKSRKLRIAQTWIPWLKMAGLLFVGLGIGFLGRWIYLEQKYRELRLLEQRVRELEALRDELQRAYEAEKALRARLEALQQQLEGAGLGGGEPGEMPFPEEWSRPENTRYLLQEWQSRWDELWLSLDSVEAEVAYRERLLKIIPSIPPLEGKWWISSRYGWRRSPISGRREFHRGVDMGGEWGANILATADGRVLAAGWYGGYGKRVVLEHESGYRTVYAHMSRIYVRKGQRVRKGQPIGRIGSTGRSTGMHLHYEVWYDGKPRNPKPFFALGLTNVRQYAPQEARPG